MKTSMIFADIARKIYRVTYSWKKWYYIPELLICPLSHNRLFHRIAISCGIIKKWEVPFWGLIRNTYTCLEIDSKWLRGCAPLFYLNQSFPDKSRWINKKFGLWKRTSKRVMPRISLILSALRMKSQKAMPTWVLQSSYHINVVAVFLFNGFRTKSIHFVNSRHLRFLTWTLIH